GGGTVYLKPGGGVWAELTHLQGEPLVPDEDFRQALPPAVAKALAALDLKDPFTLDTQLVVDTQPDPAAPPVVFWDGWAGLHNASLRAGVPVTGVSGEVACRGLHDGKQFKGVLGNVLLKEAKLFNQPVQDVQAKVVVTAEEPDVLQVPGLHARFFGG